jgi:hypothetical protein
MIARISTPTIHAGAGDRLGGGPTGCSAIESSQRERSSLSTFCAAVSIDVTSRGTDRGIAATRFDSSTSITTAPSGPGRSKFTAAAESGEGHVR